MTLVKKLKGEWSPAEKKDLKVGETIDITDPKQLILDGTVVAVLADGTEQGAFEMYGVITKDAKKEFAEYLALKKAQESKVKLEVKNEELKKELADLPVPSVEDLTAKRLAAMKAGRERAAAARAAKV